MNHDRISTIERAQIYLSIAFLIAGWHWDIGSLINVSIGIFAGSATAFFWYNRTMKDE